MLVKPLTLENVAIGPYNGVNTARKKLEIEQRKYEISLKKEEQKKNGNE